MTENLIPFYQAKDKIIEKSLDCYLYDSNGKKYIDFEAGVWCSNIGHSNPRLVNVMEKQIKNNIHHGYFFRNTYSEQLADKLHEKLGFNGGQSVFLSSGSESVNLAASISKHLTQRNKILKIDNSFLSAYGFGQISPDNDKKVDVKCNNTASIDNIDFNEISGFVLETGGASIDVVSFPDKEFVNNIIKEVRSHGGLIIVDEVTTGFGRTGKWFGFMHYDISPDIVVTAKGLGNGYPISCVSISPDVVKQLDNNPMKYLQSHINDPLGCAIGLEVINIIEDENIIERSNTSGEYLKSQFDGLRIKHPNAIMDVRARGLLLGVEFSGKINGNLIFDKLFDMGLVVGFKANTIRLLPPLTIKIKDIDELIRAINEILSNPAYNPVYNS